MLAKTEKSKRKNLTARHLHRAKQARSHSEIRSIKEEKMLSKENNKHRPCRVKKTISASYNQPIN